MEEVGKGEGARGEEGESEGEEGMREEEEREGEERGRKRRWRGEEGTSKRMVGEWVHEIQVDLDRFFSSDTKTLLVHVYHYH